MNWLRKLILKFAQIITQQVVKSVDQVLSEYQLRNKQSFNEMGAKLDRLETHLQFLEKKIEIKDLQGKQAYGHLTYKIEALKQKSD